MLIWLGVITTIIINGDIFGIAENALRRTQEEIDKELRIGEGEEIYGGKTIEEWVLGLTIEQVTDTNPGVLSGTGSDEDPYLIESVEDLVTFVKNMRCDRNTGSNINSINKNVS